jgi:MHS family proline/betaine transporter-like MFS transporter
MKRGCWPKPGTIGTLFFPSDDPASSLIAAFGAFAAGFLMRPLGSIVLGHVGDRLGRKKLLVLSILAMALPTFSIGLLPTHADIGATAAVLMVVLRMVQGFSVGGEYVGSGVFLAERAPPHRRGIFAALSSAGLVGGMLLGSAIGALITNLLTATRSQRGVGGCPSVRSGARRRSSCPSSHDPG